MEIRMTRSRVFAQATEIAPTTDESVPNDRRAGTLEDLLQRGYRFAFSLTHDAARAEDVLQEAWVSVLRARGPHTVGYLFATIRSRFVDQYRRELIAPTESLDAHPHLAAEAEATFWTERCQSVPVHAALHRAMASLRPEERAVLVLSAVEGYTAREIGELLDAPRGTVLSLMHRTRVKLRRWFQDNPKEEKA
ncbi:MAG: RNA polymerase sigma factor [Acidobacteria bacterium]|nr:MAG: RNA polymerase sigma factor [Acidobacteriota bacterium]